MLHQLMELMNDSLSSCQVSSARAAAVAVRALVKKNHFQGCSFFCHVALHSYFYKWKEDYDRNNLVLSIDSLPLGVVDETGAVFDLVECTSDGTQKLILASGSFHHSGLVV